MKRAMKLLARLYPSSWRERYGAEFETLLEDVRPSARDILDVLWGALKIQLTMSNWPRIITAFSVFGMIVAVAVSFALPVHYVSRSRLMVTPSDDFSMLTAKRVIRESAFNRQSLASIVQDDNLYPLDRSGVAQDALIDKMARNIRVIAAPGASGESGAASFEVLFDYPDHDVAQRVNGQLVGLLLAGNVDLAHREKSNLIFRVLDPPTLARMPVGPGAVRLASFGSLAGFLVGLLIVGLIKLRTAVGTRNS